MRKTKRMRKIIIAVVLGLLAAMAAYAQPAMAATRTTLQLCCTNVYYEGETVARAWGYNQYGQLGDGTYTHRNTPVRVSNLSGVKALAAGSEHSLVLKEDGTVWAWGNNSYGQLGNAAAGYGSSTPVTVSNLSGVKVIAGGGSESRAVRKDG